MNQILSDGDKYQDGVLRWGRVTGELKVLSEEVEQDLNE